MTPDILIAEGRRLARPCVFLRPRAERSSSRHLARPRRRRNLTGPAFAVGLRLMLASCPTCPKKFRVSSAFTQMKRNAKAAESKSMLRGLHDRALNYMPPKNPCFPRSTRFSSGSASIGEWLAANDWPRDERYNDNFRDHAVVKAYERQWAKEYPLYRQDGTYAVLGGWHWPCADDDWHRLMDEQLMVLTVKDSEPWVEAWCLRSGQFKVISE